MMFYYGIKLAQMMISLHALQSDINAWSNTFAILNVEAFILKG